MKDSVIIVSGGMDSITLLHEKAEEIALAVTFDYGSNHNKREAECAARHCQQLGIEHIIIPLAFIGQYFKSSLLEGADAVPEGHYEAENMKSTVVPFRNGIMLSVACGLAESRKLSKVLIANHGGDHAIYPDCRAGFVHSMSEAMRHGTYIGVQIDAPYTGISKSDIARIVSTTPRPTPATRAAKSIAASAGHASSARKPSEMPESKIRRSMKRNDANLITLNVVFVVCLIVANVVTSKVLDTGIHIGGVPILIPGAALTYAMTFLCTDVIGEIWGKKEANKAVIRGFVAQLVALVLIILTMYLPAYDEEMQRAYRMLLGQTPVFVFGSLVAYLCSQSWDVWIFHKIRGRFCGNPKRRWIWNNASTLTSQIIDTAIYISIAFGIGLGWFMQEGGMMLVLGMVIGQYLLKAGLALCDTPFFYLLTRKHQEE